MKKIFITLLGLLTISFPLVVGAAPSSVNRLTDHIEPLIRTDYIKAEYFTATSTTATSTLPRLSSTGISSSWLCIAGDCRTAWPSGASVAWGDITGTLSNQTDLQSALDLKLAITSFGTQFFNFFSATTTSALAEGSNLYFTNARADARINATSTIGTITSLPGLSLPFSQVTGTVPITQGGSGGDFDNANGLLYANSGVQNFLTVSDSTSLPTIVTGETGTGGLVFANSPTIASTTNQGTFLTGSLIATSTATSTFAGGIDIASGCFAIGGTCLSSGGSGTVTSVAMSVPTGLAISGSPITTSGTLALTYDTGYAGVLTASTTNWNGFYDVPSTRITDGTGLTWSSNTLNCDTASGSVQGCLTSADWTTFNNKVSSQWTTTGSNIYYTTGNVGIGTTSVSSKLTVAGGNITHTASGNPTILSTYNTPGTARHPYVSGDYAFVADGAAGLTILNIASSTNPTLVTTFDTNGDARAVHVSGQYAYVADGGQGIKVINISDPTTPVLVGSVAGNFSWYIYVSGAYAYASTEGAIKVFDVSDPANPTEISSTDTGAGDAVGVYAQGTNVYVADNGAGLKIYDATNPSSLSLVGSVDTAEARVVHVNGSRAYIADGSGGFVIVDISNSASPSILATYDTSDAEGVYVFGDYAYVTDTTDGLLLFDVASSTNPLLIGSVSAASAEGVYVAGKYAYVAKGANGLSIVDINGTKTPSLLTGNLETDYLTVKNNGNFGGDIYANGGLNVGLGGIYSRGKLGVSSVATSTFVNGIEIDSGCFSVNGTCLQTGVVSSQWVTSGSDIYYTTGNVAIGSTPSGAAQLEVIAPSLSTAGSVDIRSRDGGHLAFYNYSSSVVGNNDFGEPAANTAMINTGFPFYFGTYADAPLIFATNATRKATLLSNGNFGIGTSTPYAKLSVVGETVSANFTATSTTATSTFAGGLSSTGIADFGSSTWFRLPSSADPTINTQGKLAINTTVASTSISYHDGTAERILSPYKESAFMYATSTLGSGTTTIKVAGFASPRTYGKFGCTSAGSGTFVARLGNGSASSTSVISSTSNITTFTTLSSNNTFGIGDSVFYEIGSVSGSVKDPSCSYQALITP